LPNNLTVLFCNNNQIEYLPEVFPNNLQTIRCDDNPIRNIEVLEKEFHKQGTLWMRKNQE